MFPISPFFQYWQQNNYFFNIDSQDDPRLSNSLYQTRYLQNYEAVKSEYRENLKKNVSFVAVRKYFTCPVRDRRYFEFIF